MAELSERHKLFIAEYLIDLNGTRAYRKVYDPYNKKSEDSCRSSAARLLAKASIKQGVEIKTRDVIQNCGITREYVLTSLKEVAERCMTKVPVMEYNRLTQTMEQKTEEDDEGNEVGVWEFDSGGANKSLELLGKNLKLFTDKIEVAVEDSFFDKLKAARERIGKQN